jgi:hypothetical protein
MQAIDFILDTLGHFARREDGPPPGVPVSTEGDFERELTWLCEWHGITPVVLGSLDKLALRPRLSRITLERMKALDRASRGLGDDSLAAAGRLARAFADRHVEMRVLGDVALATSVYPDPGLRPIIAIELLVAEMMWPEVLDVCRAAGFRTDEPLPLFRNGVDAMHFYQHFPPCVLDNENGDRLQLRLRLFEMGEPEVAERAWERRRSLPAPLENVATVAIEDQLMHAAMVYNMTGFGKLVSAVDIALMLTRSDVDIDWTYVRDRLDERRLYPSFYFTLSKVHRWLQLPGDLHELGSPGALRRKIFDTTWPADRHTFSLERGERYHRMRFCLMECGTWREKLRFLGRMLAPRNEWVAAFFRKPYRPYLKLKFIFLMLRSRIGVRPSAG